MKRILYDLYCLKFLVKVHQTAFLFLVLLANKYNYTLFPKFSVNLQNSENTPHFGLPRVYKRLGPSLVCDIS